MTSLRRAIPTMLLGNAVFAATQFLMLVALAQFTTPETVGRYSLSLAIAAPLYFAANLKLRQVAISDTRNEYSPGQYLATRIQATGLAWIALALGSLITSDGDVLLAVSTVKALDMTSDILYTFPHKNSRFVGIAVSMSTRAILSAASFSLALLQGWALASAVWCVATVHAFAAVGDYFASRRYAELNPSWGIRANKGLALLTIPLGLALAASSLGSMLPRYALQFTQGGESVGVYSAIAYLLVAGGLVINSVGQAVTPRFADLLERGDMANFQGLLRRLAASGVIMGISGAILSLVIGDQILKAVFGPEYADAAPALAVLSIAAAITYTSVFMGTALNALRRFDVPLRVTLVSATVAAIALWPLTHYWSVTGAAVAVVIAAASELLLYARVVRKELLSIAASNRQEHQ